MNVGMVPRGYRLICRPRSASAAPTGHPIVAQGKGGTTAALGWTVFQGIEALKGRTKAVIAASPVAV